MNRYRDTDCTVAQSGRALRIEHTALPSFLLPVSLSTIYTRSSSFVITRCAPSGRVSRRNETSIENGENRLLLRFSRFEESSPLSSFSRARVVVRFRVASYRVEERQRVVEARSKKVIFNNSATCSVRRGQGPGSRFSWPTTACHRRGFAPPFASPRSRRATII